MDTKKIMHVFFNIKIKVHLSRSKDDQQEVSVEKQERGKYAQNTVCTSMKMTLFNIMQWTANFQ